MALTVSWMLLPRSRQTMEDKIKRMLREEVRQMMAQE